MSRRPGFELRWIWYLRSAASLLHALMNVLLLRREYGRKLRFAAAPAAAPLAAAE